MVLRCFNLRSGKSRDQLLLRAMWGQTCIEAAVDAPEHGHPPSEGETESTRAPKRRQNARGAPKSRAGKRSISKAAASLCRGISRTPPATRPATQPAAAPRRTRPPKPTQASRRIRRNDGTGDERRVEAPNTCCNNHSPRCPRLPMDAEAQEDDGESETESHSMRNLALAVLVAVVILAAVAVALHSRSCAGLSAERS